MTWLLNVFGNLMIVAYEARKWWQPQLRPDLRYVSGLQMLILGEA